MVRPVNVEFKAGKARLEEKSLHSDARKGILKFSISPEGIICVQWREREKSAIEDEYYFAPGDLQFIKVKNAPSGTRMYYLNFSDSGTKEFFWLQEPNADNDSKLEEGIKLIGAYEHDDDEDTMQVDTPPTTTNTQSTSTVIQPTPTSTIPTTGTTKNTASNLSSGITSSGSSNTSASSSGNSSLNMDFLKNMISNFSQNQPNKNVLLSKILTGENILPFLRENEEIRKELSKHLPEGCDSQEKIFEILHSPQYAQALEGLDYAIFEGHGGEISQLLGCEPNIQSMRGVEGFLTSIQESVNKQKKKDSDQNKK
ncbi:adhesion regulating molecule family protein [Tieghemostelium lacteum]|uniref:Adhesion regulating molecule family protein n=1 Tax=Tieghemostelium lacteum TaxID=361077 RepID=A0A152A211_TIELA|nr:adhesion regulating molecule family protein [Tieghemostelium lacteum]|eukprot:KYR00292.1 adhesion regulating molecule family protein [Tieghemostelium lacteum]